MNGRGIFSWVDGKKFVGEYLDDKKHGDGIFFWYLNNEKHEFVSNFTCD